MKLSKKTEYGLRFMLSLSELNNGKHMGIYQISLRHNIPMKFLESIAVSLRKSGLLEVKKGAGGGYRLKYPAESITLLMVYECLEGAYRKEVEIKEDFSNNQKAVYTIVNSTILDIRDALSSKTIADIRNEFRNLNESLMYYI